MNNDIIKFNAKHSHCDCYLTLPMAIELDLTLMI